VIFFARYEASQHGSPLIDTEHLLLGILRETASIVKVLPAGAPESIRAQIEARTETRTKVSISVDLPLSNASKRVLAYGAEEAERLNHRHIGSEHLFLGLLREKDCLAAKLLEPFGVKLEQVRTKAEVASAYEAAAAQLPSRHGGVAEPRPTVMIHGSLFDLKYVRDAVSRCRVRNWHWQKTSWAPRDVVIHRKSGKASFDLALAADSENFELVKGGWTKDHCAICRWEFFVSSDDHGAGYTNGRDWICLECFDKFWERPNFISGSYSDIT